MKFYPIFYQGYVMVRSSSRQGTSKRSTVAKKTAYNPGSACFVLSDQDCMQFVQLFSLLIKIERRLSASGSSPLNQSSKKQSTINLSKTKGSHISGPFVLDFRKKIFYYIDTIQKSTITCWQNINIGTII
jgi:hypothetical protein